VALRAGQTASDVPAQPTETLTDRTAIENMDETSVQKGDEPATQTVDKPATQTEGEPFVEPTDESTIKEEELPPE
jgi:hypothetical protein